MGPGLKSGQAVSFAFRFTVFPPNLKNYSLSFEKLLSSTHVIKKDATSVKEELDLDASILPLLQLCAFDFSVWS